MREEFKENAIEPKRETVMHDICPEPIVCEAAGEYTLPDYRPEIRKILHLRATVMPAGHYQNGGRAEFAGTVQHTILYADGEGKLAAVTLDADYDFSHPLPEEGEYTPTVDSMVENTTCRLSGPRKLSLRTRVRNLVHLWQEEEVAPVIRGMGSEKDLSSLEKQSERMESMTQACGSSGAFTLTSTVHLDSPAVGAEAVWAGGSLLISECRAQEGGCLCRGHAWVRCLLHEEGGLPYAVREKIPFEQLVPIAEANERSSCIGYGRLLAAEVELLPGEGEENGSLVFTVSAEVDACATGTQICNPVSDLYSTDYEMSCHYRPLTATRSLGAVMGNYTVSGSRARSECDCENAATVVDADGRMEIHSVQVERGRAVVCGKLLTVAILTAAEEEAMPLLSAEVAVPFRIETELRPAPGTQPRFDCHGELISARARIEQNAITVDCEIALALSAYEDETRQVLAEAEPDRSLPVEHRGNRVYVVYPREEDTLFSVAARYHKSRAAIAAQNGLGEGVLAVSHMPASLDGVHHLLIED
ncbi:MAG: DUF3794 domain-containing protein [Clostridia bacterium]|nr:DUF3794 domain-containing protein [Clostridia bacterium]